MLVLSRKIEEAISIDGNIRVVVLSVRNGTVKLGVEAPKTVSVLREELKEKKP